MRSSHPIHHCMWMEQKWTTSYNDCKFGLMNCSEDCSIIFVCCLLRQTLSHWTWMSLFELNLVPGSRKWFTEFFDDFAFISEFSWRICVLASCSKPWLPWTFLLIFLKFHKVTFAQFFLRNRETYRLYKQKHFSNASLQN